MCKLVKLSNNKIKYFKFLNDNRKNFNLLNEDFFEIYDISNLFQQYYLKKKVILLRENNKYLGYIWFEFTDNGECIISSIYSYIEQNNYYNILLNIIDKYTVINYSCIANDINTTVMIENGFTRVGGTIEMICNLKETKFYQNLSDINYQVFSSGKDEKVRCQIQNEVFKNNKRIPLSVEDIYYDETQKYYIQNGAIFIKENDCFAGYGQIILGDDMPVIVNLGILNEYRNKGYAKQLMICLLKIAKDMSYDEVKIRVSYDNKVAINLYKNFGFNCVSEKYDWKKECPA